MQGSAERVRYSGALRRRVITQVAEVPVHAQIFVMGPIVVLVRRPSLRIPVDPEDVTQEVGAIQTIARISSFASEMPSDVTLKGDPPQWVVQARSC